MEWSKVIPGGKNRDTRLNTSYWYSHDVLSFENFFKCLHTGEVMMSGVLKCPDCKGYNEFFTVPGTYICWEPHPKTAHTDGARK